MSIQGFNTKLPLLQTVKYQPRKTSFNGLILDLKSTNIETINQVKTIKCS